MSESLLISLARGCRDLASRCQIAGGFKVGAVSGCHLMSACMPAQLGKNGVHPWLELPRGGCGGTRGFSDATKLSSASEQPGIEVAVRPFLSHACEAPPAIAETSASELMHMLMMMTTIRRSELVADKVTRWRTGVHGLPLAVTRQQSAT